MTIECKTCDKQNWIRPGQDMGPNSTINTHMRLSVRHCFSHEKHGLDFGGYVCAQPEGRKKKGVKPFRVPPLFSAMFWGDFVNWIRPQEERPHRKIILHLISTLQVSFSISWDNTYTFKTRKVAIQISMCSPPTRNAMLIRFLSPVREAAASCCCGLTLTFSVSFYA